LQNLLKENLQFWFHIVFYRPSCRSNFSIRKWNALESGTHQDLLKADGRYAELLIYKQEVINNKMIIFLKIFLW
jgi:hypothetical protein